MKLLLITLLSLAVALSAIEGNQLEEDVVANVRNFVFQEDHLIDSMRDGEEVMEYEPRGCKKVGRECKKHCDCCGATTTCELNSGECVESQNRNLQCYTKVMDCGMVPQPICPGEDEPWRYWELYGRMNGPEHGRHA